MRWLSIGLALLLIAGKANAACNCRCVDGQVQPICDRAVDLPRPCPPTLCPLPAPSVAPISRPTLPPLGTSQCRQAQVCGPSGCGWQEVCR